MMKVEYSDHMGNDLMVVNSARVSFGKRSTWAKGDQVWHYPTSPESVELECQVGPLKGADRKLIEFLASGLSSADMDALVEAMLNLKDISEAQQLIYRIQAVVKHWTPFAAPQVQLLIKAPIAVARQLLRSQVGLVVNETSRRYVDGDPEFFKPENWRSRPDTSIKQGSGEELPLSLDVSLSQHYSDHMKASEKLYTLMLGQNVAPEMARFHLPQSMMTEWVWTGSLLAWARICQQRLDKHAQKESQEIASMIEAQVYPLFPVSWHALMRGVQR